MNPEDLSRLSTLLDKVLDLNESEREAWFATLSGDAAGLAPTLRKLLDRQALQETRDLLDCPPRFTLPSDGHGAGFQPGDAVGAYRLLREIGQGGMGEVWLAERSDGQWKRTVALKLPMLGMRRSLLVQRFSRERDILGALSHPHIARLYDAGLAQDGQPYLALEYVDGQPITAYCETKLLDLRQRVQLGLQVMTAVQYAHANLVIHRDLKPSNVLVTAHGHAMLLDFGIAKLLLEDQDHLKETELTRLGGRALTLEYAAPEQVTGAPISIATDIWALGVLLYEMLSGKRPFTGTRREVEQAILSEEPARPRALPVDLAHIVLKTLKKRPAERFATVDALADDLRRWLNGEAVRAQPDSTWYRTRKFVGRNQAAVATGFGVLVTVIAAGAVSFWQAQVAREQTRIAWTEAKTAEAVQSFLEGIFRANSGDQTDPIKARQRTAKALLDEGAARIEKTLDDAPAAKLRVLHTLAKMYEDMDENNSSAALYRQSYALAERAFGESSIEAAHSSSDLGRALAEAEDLAGARQALDRAVAILERNPDPTGRAEIARDLGLATFYLRDNPKLGVSPAERALNVLRKAPPSAELLLAFTLLGANLFYREEFDRARRVLEEGIAIAPLAPGGGRSALIELLIELGRVHGKLGDVDSAERNFATALELSDLDNGPTGLHSLVILGLRGEMLALNSRLVESARWTGTARQRILAWPDSPDRAAQVPGFTSNDAISLVRVGRPEQAIEVATIGLQYCDVVKGNAHWPANLRVQRAAALLQLGYRRDADQDLAAARAFIVSAGLENAYPGRVAALTEARALVVGGSGVAALERWLRHRRDGGLRDEPSADDLTALAEFELAAKLHAAALAHAEQVLTLLSSRPKPANHAEVEAQSQLLRGSALLKLQRAPEAVAPLRESVRLRAATMDVQGSPMLLESRLAFADALLTNNDLVAAGAQLALARDMASRHARLGEQYLAPLRTIQQRLKAAQM